MKIFFACHRFPFPPNRGGKIRPFNIIRHLSQKHEVVVASLAHTQQELDEGDGLKEYCAEIYAEVVPEKVRWLQAVQALPTATPSSVAYFGSSRLRQRIKEAARKNFLRRRYGPLRICRAIWSGGSSEISLDGFRRLGLGQMARLFEMAFFPSFLGLLPGRA